MNRSSTTLLFEVERLHFGLLVRIYEHKRRENRFVRFGSGTVQYGSVTVRFGYGTGSGRKSLKVNLNSFLILWKCKNLPDFRKFAHINKP